MFYFSFSKVFGGVGHFFQKGSDNPSLFLTCASKAAFAHAASVIVECYAVLNEDTLRKSIEGAEGNGFVFVCIICNFNKDMPLVFGIIVIAVDNSDGVVELEAELKAKSASRVDFKYPLPSKRAHPLGFLRFRRGRG